ncbi:GNAT family N-acetyltransferase [Streptomyces sp. NBC_01601]|uniref:GNAT family N-acetyltransferase n=1 Tax=Streptomyces sp. NBC_01601 TaxID=2975892 RepID=UPI002E2C8634|nr:GNAT family N-acetyltransferase [Streptomyces sp. NBC_01601]
MEILDIGPDSPQFMAVYDELLREAFLPDELMSAEEFREAAQHGTLWVTGAIHDGRPAGAAVAEWSQDSQVLLLSYIAVRPDLRGTGIGGQLMTAVHTTWQDRVHPLLTLAELEHPHAHQRHTQYGDPIKRLRFYARHNALALDLPYFQPAMKPGGRRVPGMILALLAAAPGFASAGVAPAGPVRAFMTEYLTQTEGRIGLDTDPEGAALFQAMSAADIRLLPLDARHLVLAGYQDGSRLKPHRRQAVLDEASNAAAQQAWTNGI